MKINKNVMLVVLVVALVGLAFVSVSEGNVVEEESMESYSLAPMQFDCIQGTPGCPALCEDGLEGC